MNPFSSGLPVEGFHCCLYIMTIVEHRIYMPFMLRRFSLTQDVEDVANTLVCVKATTDEQLSDPNSQKPPKKLMKPFSYTKLE